MYNVSATDTHNFLLKAKSYSAGTRQQFIANLHAMTVTTRRAKHMRVTKTNADLFALTSDRGREFQLHGNNLSDEDLQAVVN